MILNISGSAALSPIAARYLVSDAIAQHGPAPARNDRVFWELRGSTLGWFSSVRGAVDLTMARLLTDVSAGLRVLKSRDGLALTEGQIRERAHNIVMGLLMNYRIEAMDDEDAPAMEGESSESLFEGAPVTGQG